MNAQHEAQNTNQVGTVLGLILAAGLSRRMGRQKLLLPAGTTGDSGSRMTVVEQVLRTAVASTLDSVMVVVGEQDVAVRERTAHGPWTQVLAPHPEEGMSHSLKVGVERAMQQGASALMVMLGDQPDVSLEAIHSVIVAWQQARRVDNQRFERAGQEIESAVPLVFQPSYRGEPGHPVLFDSLLFGELMQVKGDEGGRSVLRRHADAVMRVPVQLSAPPDLDTPEAYESWLGEKRT